VVIGGPVLSESGHVTVKGGRVVFSGIDARIATGGAGTVTVDSGGGITMGPLHEIVAASGDIRVVGNSSVTVGRIATAGDVSIVSGRAMPGMVGVPGHIEAAW